MRDRANIDPGFSESAEELSGHAGMIDHVVAHGGENAAILSHVDHLDLIMMKLGEKRPLDGLARESGLGFGNRKADRML